FAGADGVVHTAVDRSAAGALIPRNGHLAHCGGDVAGPVGDIELDTVDAAVFVIRTLGSQVDSGTVDDDHVIGRIAISGAILYLVGRNTGDGGVSVFEIDHALALVVDLDPALVKAHSDVAVIGRPELPRAGDRDGRWSGIDDSDVELAGRIVARRVDRGAID